MNDRAIDPTDSVARNDGPARFQPEELGDTTSAIPTGLSIIHANLEKPLLCLGRSEELEWGKLPPHPSTFGSVTEAVLPGLSHGFLAEVVAEC